jgi:vacuolar protein sorting-associated protein 13A/C
VCLQIARVSLTGGINATLSSQERLDLNISTTFAELVITTVNMWGREGERVLQKARGTYAPYQIRNRTGSPIFVWSDLDGSNSARDGAAVKIANNQTIDWRFDDWKTMREVQFCLYKYIDV